MSCGRRPCTVLTKPGTSAGERGRQAGAPGREGDFKCDAEKMKPGTKNADLHITLTQSLKTSETKCCSGINYIDSQKMTKKQGRFSMTLGRAVTGEKQGLSRKGLC